jgi:dTDP-4-amino-4,6-dideoxygalactose transaminase
MMETVARYGTRTLPGMMSEVAAAFRDGEAVQGGALGRFEEEFARYHGVEHAVTASYGRMAFRYILRALELPPGSQILFPALTFWVIPEMARVLGFEPVFVDVDPVTFNLSAEKMERAITGKTRAVVPTHLYGQPCDMDAILAVARRHDLRVIEDCAHSIGARYHGKRTGTFGDAAFFSFQMLKGLNTQGGGMAITDDPVLAARIRAFSDGEPWPSATEIARKFLLGRMERLFISPQGFTFSLFPLLYLGSFLGERDLTRFLWEKIRPLDPLPASYSRRYSNVQARLGICMLENLDALNDRSRSNAARLTEGLRDIPSIRAPRSVPDAEPVYYQYCIRVSDPWRLSQRAIRRGIDLEIMHVDICNRLDLFAPYASSCPVAESTEGTLQLPVHSGLSPDAVERILRVLRDASRELPPLTDPLETPGVDFQRVGALRP